MQDRRRGETGDIQLKGGNVNVLVDLGYTGTRQI